MDEHLIFSIDVCTIAALFTLSLYNLRLPRKKGIGVSRKHFPYLSLYTLGLATYIFFRSTIEVLSRGNVLPSLYLEFFWYDNIMLPGVVAGATIMFFSSMGIVALAVNFTRLQKGIGFALGVAPTLIFFWSLSALWVGQSWYNFNYELINSLYLAIAIAQVGLTIFAMIKNKYQRRLPVFLVVATLLTVLIYLSLAQTINFSFNTIALGIVSVWLTIITAGMPPTGQSPHAPIDEGNSVGAIPNHQQDWNHACLDRLSSSQKKVAELLLTGLEYKEIADATGLSLSAVKRRIHAIYQTFGVQNRTEFFLECRSFP